MGHDDPLHRRQIRAALIARHGWRVTSRVDGSVDVDVPPDVPSANAFADAVRSAVGALGYSPTVVIGASGRMVRVQTAETLQQAGRGAHGSLGSQRACDRHTIRADRRTAPTVRQGGVRPSPSRSLGASDGGVPSWLDVLEPLSVPYRSHLSQGSDLLTWHLEAQFRAFHVTADWQARWEHAAAAAADTWNKRPLLAGTDSGCPYSCGEVELVARFRTAGYTAYWISEWSGFPHVPSWQPFCIKRSELRERLPNVWEHDRALRSRFPDLDLGPSGGHPDVVAWRPGATEFRFVEYKGPGDSIRPKQAAWATALLRIAEDDASYAVVIGRVRQ
ncbi:VRR-NUC domain-containing protein [Roseisolibacter agri]|uniref:VRR-NUC domain-containing protein n=1 Tax=Roseisolibacter agri TaxID=2014610 RepID=A0AA37VG20_9BACT|nr:VRR-NUC domain-containing protein [Roseisolibacter agri]GLC27764.1 hypothetical protein rosag_42770 [Roseisolibacter agri]